MANETVTVLCGRCKVGVDGPPNPKPQDTITCPKCGRSDSFKNVMASVEKFSTDLLQKKMSEGFKRAFSGSKGVKFTAKPVPSRSYPFITNMKL